MGRRIEGVEKKRMEQEKRERRFNIVLRGVEVEGRKVKDVVAGVLKRMVDLDKGIQIREAFKIGNGEKGNVILVKLNSMDDKRVILERKNKLKGTSVYVDEDLTKIERDRQRVIRVWAKNGREKEQIVRIGFSKAWVDGKEYVWDEKRGMVGRKNI